MRKKWKKKRQRSKEQSPGAYQRAHRRRLERWKVSILTRQRKRKQKRFPARGTPDHYTESVLSDCIAGIQSIFRCIPTRLQNREAGDPDWILDATVVHIGSSVAKVRTKKCVCKLISHDRNGAATPSRGFSRWIVAGRSLICNAATRLPVRRTNATHTLESSDIYIYPQFCNWKACLWRKS